MSRFFRAFAMQVAIVILVLIAGFGVHAYRTQPRPVRILVERELHGRVLARGESVQVAVDVFRRRPGDYFRATRGMLALTQQRLVYVGLAPRDILGPEEMLPVFESRDFPIDTLLTVVPTRTLLGAARALALVRHDERIAYGIPDEQWGSARVIVSSIAARHTVQRGEAHKERREREQADSLARAPKWHIVGRGEALSTIASQYGTTPERIRELNSLAGDKIKVGQRLLVKPQT